MKIIFLSFANQAFYTALERIKKEAESFRLFDQILCLRDTDLVACTSFWEAHGDFVRTNARGYGYWIWKSYLVMKIMQENMKEDDILVYADAGCSLNIQGISRLRTYMDWVHGILSFELGHVEKMWTKKDLFVYFNVNDPQFLNSKQIMATSF